MSILLSGEEIIEATKGHSNILCMNPDHETFCYEKALIRAQLRGVKQYWHDYGIVKLDEMLTEEINRESAGR